MTPAREDILPQPRKESRQSPPRPSPGLSFKLQALPSAARPLAPAAGAPLSPSPHPRAPLPPEEAAPPAPERGAATPSPPHTGPFAHKNHLLRRREQRKSLTFAVVQQLKLGLGTRRPQALFTGVPPQSWLLALLLWAEGELALPF